MSNVIYLDLGPNSFGYTTQVAGEKVCVLSSQAVEDRASQVRARRFMKAQGQDCKTCGGCPIGQAS
ncbi:MULTISPECIES: hypothetical protein [Streptomyces]|uniref:Uncharacterized protein n=1 Tax=Streptomyces bangladeshensis TaxID=295352 RepID=A0ABN3BSS2_9ACTN|nr:hypothetical protein [Streptomyces sp. FBKL.4005]